MEEKGGSSLQRSTKNMANDAVKCNYIIYWSGEIGMELVENGKLKERSMMETGTLSTGILIYLKNI